MNSAASGDSLTLLGVFFLGLGLNLTPCVYPMLSITVSLFGAQQEKTRLRAFIKALIYVLGIATIYSTLGVVTAFTGGLFGAALQNRFVLLGIGGVFTALSLSMFGLYTIQAPSWILNKLSGKRAAGLLGIYLSGAFVGVFAAPCVGPPVLALLAYVGSKGDPAFAFWTFFVMSLGLGFPYLILGTFAGLLSKLPRSGVWLLWVDRLFATILLSLGVFYLLLAVRPSLLPWLIPVSLAAGGIYLGFIEKAGANSPQFTGFKRSFGVIAISAGCVLPFFAPKQLVVWDTYSEEKVQAANAAGKPVIMDFYADWCIPCHELDQYTYSDPAVIKALDSFIRLKVNLTDPDNQAAADATEKFAIQGVPSVIFLDAQGEEIKKARITGFVPAKEFLENLHSQVKS